MRILKWTLFILWEFMMFLLVWFFTGNLMEPKDIEWVVFAWSGRLFAFLLIVLCIRIVHKNKYID